MSWIELVFGFFKGGSSIIGLKVKIAAMLIAVSLVFGAGFKVAMWKSGAAKAGALIAQRGAYNTAIEKFNARIADSEGKRLVLSTKYKDLLSRKFDEGEIPDCTIGPAAFRMWNDAGSY